MKMPMKVCQGIHRLSGGNGGPRVEERVEPDEPLPQGAHRHSHTEAHLGLGRPK